ncbi:plastocyanin/azurin family copper-binding protein [Halobellus sp. EA9]|uniref:plastocyanin/azurin family copper-binding protein n=1 Tax=Halobellus sp. EA9 TaxID=3421647 RepID=UPI003EB83604
MNRRTFVRALAVTGTIAIAGCSSGSGSGGSSGNSGGGTATETATATSGGSGAQWKQTSTVEMTDTLKYVPKRIEVKKGTKVTWKNTGSIGHTVTAYEGEIPDGAAYFASGGFDSEQAATDGYSNDQKGNIPKGESYSHTFETTGTYKYFCIPHELNGMVGYVKVV